MTAVLTLVTISVDSRKDLPRVPYATALDLFIIMCFMYVIGSLLEFAGVHYFTKIGSGDKTRDSDSDEWEDEDMLNDVCIRYMFYKRSHFKTL